MASGPIVNNCHKVGTKSRTRWGNGDSGTNRIEISVSLSCDIKKVWDRIHKFSSFGCFITMTVVLISIEVTVLTGCGLSLTKQRCCLAIGGRFCSRKTWVTLMIRSTINFRGTWGFSWNPLLLFWDLAAAEQNQKCCCAISPTLSTEVNQD